jgi:hypothetical protein
VVALARTRARARDSYRLERELAGVQGELTGVREALDEARARAGAAEARAAELSADLAAERSRSLWGRLTRLLGGER